MVWITVKIPREIFDILVLTDRDKMIGDLSCQEDLDSLISWVQKESLGVFPMSLSVPKGAPPNLDMKSCGHLCTYSSVKTGCCSCMDQRPIRVSGHLYPRYKDGKGWVDDATRGAGYCPHCHL